MDRYVTVGQLFYSSNLDNLNFLIHLMVFIEYIIRSSPIYPDPGRYWETVERLKINQLYLAPTAIRLLLKYDNQWVEKYDKTSLKT